MRGQRRAGDLSAMYCDHEGDTVPSLADCLIAAVALRERRPLLTLDRDFDVIARHIGLELAATEGT